MITATQLKQKIRHLAAQKEMDPQLLQRAFVMEQFLFLLGLTKHKDNFIIKGGFLIRSLLGVEKRTTMDIDTTVCVLQDFPTQYCKEKVHTFAPEIFL